MSTSDRVPLGGSARVEISGAQPIGPADPDETAEVTVIIRPGTTGGFESAFESATTVRGGRRFLSYEELASMRAADSADIERIQAFAADHGLDVVDLDQARRRIVLRGSVAALNDAFGVDLQRYEHGGVQYRMRTGPVMVPADVAQIVQGVFGLDNRPQATPHLRRGQMISERDVPGGPSNGAAPHIKRGPLIAEDAVSGPDVGAAGARVEAEANTTLRFFTPPQLAHLLGFPTGVTGAGQCIGIVELGGGFSAPDISVYFAKLGLTAPAVTAVSVLGGQNTPGADANADGEVMLDIEVAGAIAPGSKIVVYFAPDASFRSFVEAVSAAIHDAQNKPSIISISWGAPEEGWSQQGRTAMDEAFKEAATLGISVFVAAGDSGSDDGVGDGRQHADYPASSPYVTACGGTRLTASATAIQSEVVWDDAADSATGGGVSELYPLPDYQANAGVPASANPLGHTGRGVPDLAGDASPASGYAVLVDGQWQAIGGTSAVAPLYAGLSALANQMAGGATGFLNPILYAPAGAGVFVDITSGGNGAYQARTGWDPCTGLGRADGAKFASVLTAAASGSGATPTDPTEPGESGPQRAGSLLLQGGQDSATQAGLVIQSGDIALALLQYDSGAQTRSRLFVRSATLDAAAGTVTFHLNEPVPQGSAARVGWVLAPVES